MTSGGWKLHAFQRDVMKTNQNYFGTRVHAVVCSSIYICRSVHWLSESTRLILISFVTVILIYAQCHNLAISFCYTTVQTNVLTPYLSTISSRSSTLPAKIQPPSHDPIAWHSILSLAACTVHRYFQPALFSASLFSIPPDLPSLPTISLLSCFH